MAGRRAISTFSSRSQPHPIFQRDGHDLHCRAPISFVTAALGGSIEVPTLDGGARQGHRSRKARKPASSSACAAKACRVLRGGGMARRSLRRGRRSRRRSSLRKKQKELLREFEKESERRMHPETEGFFAKVKEFLGGTSDA